jgi:saccharopepsin
VLTASFSLDIPNQALMDVSSASNPALSYGADGILGLGFTSLSTIDALVNKSGSSAGRALLYNAFSQNKSEPNFIAFTLERSGDSDADAISGSFAIGEYEPQYAKIADTSAIPTWPIVAPTRWNILLEALIVNQTITSVSTNVTGAPSNRAVALLDSGTSYRYIDLHLLVCNVLSMLVSYASEDFCNAIYSGISGAQYDPSLQQWVVPCNAEIDMALQFGRV